MRWLRPWIFGWLWFDVQCWAMTFKNAVKMAPCPYGQGAIKSVYPTVYQCATCTGGSYCRSGSMLRTNTVVEYGLDGGRFDYVEIASAWDPIASDWIPSPDVGSEASPAFWNESVLIVGDSMGTLSTLVGAASVTSGSPNLTVTPPSAPTIYNGVLYVGTGDGEVLSYNGTMGTPLVSTNTSGRTTPRFDEVTGRLYVATSTAWLRYDADYQNYTVLNDWGSGEAPLLTIGDPDGDSVQDLVWVIGRELKWAPIGSDLALNRSIPLRFDGEGSRFSVSMSPTHQKMVVGDEMGRVYFFEKRMPQYRDRQACAAGFWCPPGSVDERGRTNDTDVAKRCVLGEYCNGGAGSNRRCSRFHYCPDPLTEKECPPGFRCDEEGLTQPLGCPTGWYCTFGEATAECDADHYCPPNASAPIPCDVETCEALLNASEYCDAIQVSGVVCTDSTIQLLNTHPLTIEGGEYQNVTISLLGNVTMENVTLDSVVLNAGASFTLRGSVIQGSTWMNGTVSAQGVQFSMSDYVYVSGSVELVDSLVRYINGTVWGGNNTCLAGVGESFGTSVSICGNQNTTEAWESVIDFNACIFSGGDPIFTCRECYGTQAFWGAPCTNCTAGTRSINNACEQCAPGRYASSEASTECRECVIGNVPNDDQTDCELCRVGTFANEPGMAVCTPCPSSQFVNVVGNYDGCQWCPIGTTSERSNGSECEACTPSDAASTCTACQCDELMSPSLNAYNETATRDWIESASYNWILANERCPISPSGCRTPSGMLVNYDPTLYEPIPVICIDGGLRVSVGTNPPAWPFASIPTTLCREKSCTSMDLVCERANGTSQPCHAIGVDVDQRMDGGTVSSKEWRCPSGFHIDEAGLNCSYGSVQGKCHETRSVCADGDECWPDFDGNGCPGANCIGPFKVCEPTRCEGEVWRVSPCYRNVTYDLSWDHQDAPPNISPSYERQVVRWLNGEEWSGDVHECPFQVSQWDDGNRQRVSFMRAKDHVSPWIPRGSRLTILQDEPPPPTDDSSLFLDANPLILVPLFAMMVTSLYATSHYDASKGISVRRNGIAFFIGIVFAIGSATLFSYYFETRRGRHLMLWTWMFLIYLTLIPLVSLFVMN